MLNRTVFASGVPVAVAQAIPNPAVAGQTINLSAAGSFHQDPAKTIVAWVWDKDNNGSYETSGLTTTVSYPSVGNYTVGLQVTDNVGTTAITSVTIVINTPPIAPTANAGGPYYFCKIPGMKWFLDGSKSSNPDDGLHQAGQYPGDYIKQYAWETTGDNLFNDFSGVTPDVTNFMDVGSRNISLKVTDNTAASFPSSGQPDLTGTSSTQVYVRAADDPACSCISNLTAKAKNGVANLSWTWKSGAHHYNVYRGTATGGPYTKVGSVMASTRIGGVNTGIYSESGLTGNVPYYYVVREAANNDTELCQSNQASATSISPKPPGR